MTRPIGDRASRTSLAWVKIEETSSLSPSLYMGASDVRDVRSLLPRCAAAVSCYRSRVPIPSVASMAGHITPLIGQHFPWGCHGAAPNPSIHPKGRQ